MVGGFNPCSAMKYSSSMGVYIPVTKHSTGNTTRFRGYQKNHHWEWWFSELGGGLSHIAHSYWDITTTGKLMRTPQGSRQIDGASYSMATQTCCIFFWVFTNQRSENYGDPKNINKPINMSQGDFLGQKLATSPPLSALHSSSQLPRVQWPRPLFSPWHCISKFHGNHRNVSQGLQWDAFHNPQIGSN